MSEEKISEILERLEGLPPLPAAVCRLLELADDMDSDIREMSRVISEDQALAGRILRVANSAFYGLSQRIKTVSHSIVILGFREVRNLAVGVTLVGSKLGKGDNAPISHEDFWRHSIGTAISAQMLGSHMKMPVAEEAYVAGLIHDIGKLVFLEFFPEEYRLVLADVANGKGRLFELEAEQLGMSHAKVGRRLCQHWKIPESLTKTVAFHHGPPRTGDVDPQEAIMASTVRLANNTCKIAGVGFSGEPHIEDDVFAQDGSNLSMSVFHSVLGSLPAELKKAEVFFHISGESDKRVPDRAEPAAVGMLLRGTESHDVLSMILVSMGYQPISGTEIGKNKDMPFAGVIADYDLPAAIKNFCASRSIPTLDLRECHDPDGDSETPVNASRLQEWLRANLAPRVTAAVAASASAPPDGKEAPV